MGEPEDGVYDWMLLNGGKGWEATVRYRFLAVPVYFDIVWFYSRGETTSSRPRLDVILHEELPSSSLDRRPLHLPPWCGTGLSRQTDLPRGLQAAQPLQQLKLV